MIVILDVSGTMQVVLKKEKFNKFKEEIDNASLVLAPDLYISELTNTLWKYYHTQIFTDDECHQYIEDGISLIDKFVDTKSLWREAFGEGVKNDHSIYDMYYAVLARQNDGILITNDSDLSKICKKNSIKYCF
jgi:predicted nucleic acid-binding protein